MSGGWTRVRPHRRVTVRSLDCIVDGFKYAGRHCSIYILTHFHADHYDGLTERFDSGLIHCSPITARLLPTLGIDTALIVPHAYRQPFVLQGVQLTFVEANHCPGAILILFQPLVPSPLPPPSSPTPLHTPSSPNPSPPKPSTRRKLTPSHPPTTSPTPPPPPPSTPLIPLLSGEDTVLHTGDFRFDESMKLTPPLSTFRPDRLYLDTTYSSPSFCFPLQSASIRHLLHCLLPHLADPSTLVLLSTYVIGKEKLFRAIHAALHVPIYTSPRKYRLLALMQTERMSDYTTDPYASRFHVCGWKELGETWPYFKPSFRNADVYLARYNDGKLREEEEEGKEGEGVKREGTAATQPVSEEEHKEGEGGDGDRVKGEEFEFITEQHRRLARQTSRVCTSIVGFVPTGWVHSKTVTFPPPVRRKVDGSAFDGGVRRRSQKAKQADAEAKSIHKLSSLPSPDRVDSSDDDDVGFEDAEVASATEPILSPTSSSAGGAAGAGGLAPHVIYLVPYSEHSSFSELQSCVKFFRPRLIIPTVFSDEKHRSRILAHFSGAVDRTANVRSFLHTHFVPTQPQQPAAADTSLLTAKPEREDEGGKEREVSEDGEEGKQMKVEEAEVIRLDDDDGVVELERKESVEPLQSPPPPPATSYLCHACRRSWRDCPIGAADALQCPHCSSSFVEEQQSGGDRATSSPPMLLTKRTSSVTSQQSPSRAGGADERLHKAAKKGSDSRQLSLSAFFQAR